MLAGLSAIKEIEPLDINDFDPDLDAGTRARIETGVFKRIPALAPGGIQKKAGHQFTPSPMIGIPWSVPEPALEGYYACFGGSGHGFKLGPPIGEALADMIAGDEPDIDIYDLRPGRFLEGESFTSAWGTGNRA